MIRLFVWEVRKLAGEPAARAGMAVLTGVLVLALIGFAASSRDKSGGGEGPKKTARQMKAAGELPIPAIYLKGLGFAKHVLDPVSGILIPVILCVALAGTVAGESESGTLSEVLARPVSRFRLLAAKLAAGIVLTAFLTVVAAAVAIPLSSLVLGSGRLLTKIGFQTASDPETGVIGPKLVPEYLTGAAALMRVLGAWAVAAAALAPVVALAVLASCAARRSRVAATASAGIYLGLYALGRMPALGSFRRYMIAGRADIWQAFLKPEIEWKTFASGAAALVVVFLLLSGGAVLVLGGREFPPRD
ncbi:MAG: ABC transporter permease subunit [Planctomycetota bacterium]|jgi:ABC-2 type transport system permease protein